MEEKSKLKLKTLRQQKEKIDKEIHVLSSKMERFEKQEQKHLENEFFGQQKKEKFFNRQLQLNEQEEKLLQESYLLNNKLHTISKEIIEIYTNLEKCKKEGN